MPQASIKFKAVNNKGRNFTDRKLKRALKDVDKKIDAYLDELDENDAQESESSGTQILVIRGSPKAVVLELLELPSTL